LDDEAIEVGGGDMATISCEEDGVKGDGIARYSQNNPLSKSDHECRYTLEKL